VSSLQDPALKTLKIGVQLIGDNGFNTPPAHALAALGLANNIRGYTVYGDYRDESPAAGIVEAVRKGEIDVAAVWGPLAGYFASRGEPKLAVTPISDAGDFPALRFQFDIAIGVRKGDTAMKAKIDDVLDRRRADIERLLQSYSVPAVSSGALQPVSNPTASEARSK